MVSEPTPAVTAAQVAILPVMLFRRGRVPLHQLAPLVPERSVALSDAADEAAHSAAELGTELRDALYAAVSAANAADRRMLISVQRDLFNGRRPPAERLAAARAALGPDEAAAFGRWQAARDKLDRLNEQLSACFAAELEQGRDALRAVVSDETFLRGLQLSGEHLYRSALAYVAQDSAVPGKRERKTESALISFAYRAALKPSPFGSFTEVGAHRLGAAGNADEGRPVSFTRWSRMFLEWAGWAAAADQEIRARLPLRVTSTAQLSRDKVTFLRRRAADSVKLIDEDERCELSAGPLVRSVLLAMSELSSPSQAAVESRLTYYGAAPEVATLAVRRLIGVGLLEQGFGIGDQEPSYASRMADVLASTCVPAAAAAAEQFRALAKSEAEFAGASRKRRDQILNGARDTATAMARRVGTEPPTYDVVRSYMFEDVVTAAPAWTADTGAIAGAAAALGSLCALLPLFDDATMERAGLHEFFVASHGPSGRCGLISFYEQFSALGPGRITEVMTGAGSQPARAIRTHREDFLTGLADLLRPGGTEIALTGGHPLVDAAVTAARQLGIAWDSATFRIQALSEREGPGAVVCNGAASGHGVFFSRFAELLDQVAGDQDWLVTDTVRQQIREQSAGRQADLAAVFGLNFNLHPPLAPLQVEYPGCVALPEYGPLVHLRDLVVRADERRPALVLEDADGRPVRLVPLNFLFPAAAPTLYRFLCAMAPTITLRGWPWERLRRFDRGTPDQLPRLLLDDVVIDRAQCSFAASDVPWLDPGLDEMRRWQAAREWRERTGVWRQSFYRFASFESGGTSGDWRDALRQWTLESRRARLRKPHYLDLHNPFLLTVAARQQESAGTERIILSECLPSTERYQGTGAQRAAEEIVVQADIPSVVAAVTA